MNDRQAVMVLLASGRGRIASTDSHGRTPLIHAAMAGHVELARLLAGFGPELEHRDADGLRALDYAVMHKHEELAALLEGLHEDDDTEQDQGPQEPFVWCLVGNIVEKRYYGPEREVQKGTLKFTPGTKVYCFPILWGDGYDQIKVIGRIRGTRKLHVVVTAAKYVTNWRLRKVFQPYVVRVMRELHGWDASDQSKAEIEGMLTWLPGRTEHVVESDG